MIESLLEESYTSTFHMNNNIAKFDLLNGNLLESILPKFKTLIALFSPIGLQ